MKINEFVGLANNSKTKMLHGDQLQQVLAKAIDVKKYLSIKEKRALIDEIINDCILYEDGVYKFDDIDKYIAFTMKTIEAYTNLELSEDIERDYDELCEAKLLNVVIETFSGEYENVSLLLQMKCDYILNGNNIEAQFGKFLNSILGKLDDLSAVLSNGMQDLDLSKLPINSDDIGKLMDFINNQKN